MGILPMIHGRDARATNLTHRVVRDPSTPLRSAQGDRLAVVRVADLIISWNFKHIVHFDKIRQYNRINALHGYQAIDIRSPQEVVGYEEDI